MKLCSGSLAVSAVHLLHKPDPQHPPLQNDANDAHDAKPLSGVLALPLDPSCLDRALTRGVFQSGIRQNSPDIPEKLEEQKLQPSFIPTRQPRNVCILNARRAFFPPKKDFQKLPTLRQKVTKVARIDRDKLETD